MTVIVNHPIYRPSAAVTDNRTHVTTYNLNSVDGKAALELGDKIIAKARSDFKHNEYQRRMRELMAERKRAEREAEM